MGELIRFPGAETDFDYLDSFEWTDALLREYADRARALADRYGNAGPLADLPRALRGPCQDCGQTPGQYAGRYKVGRFLLCSSCASSRVRVRGLVA